jgi:hypothetical protein
MYILMIVETRHLQIPLGPLGFQAMKDFKAAWVSFRSTVPWMELKPDEGWQAEAYDLVTGGLMCNEGWDLLWQHLIIEHHIPEKNNK